MTHTVTRVPPNTVASSESPVLVGLNDRVPLPTAALLGFQHMLAMVVGTITPPLLLGRTLGWTATEISLLINMALLVSGIASFIQIRRLGGIVGSGLLSVQGTSFAFFGVLIEAGHEGGAPLMFGMSMAAAPVGLLLGPLLPRLHRFFPPLVAGVIVMLIGLSLIPTAMINVGAGFGSGAPAWQALGVAAATMLTIIGLGSLRLAWARTSAVALGLVVGTVLAATLGHAPHPQSSTAFVLPHPLHFGLAFRWQLLLPFVFVFFVSALETVGDVTATAHLSGLSIHDDTFFRRLRGGVMADSVNSIIASFLNAFPNTTYAQNNGVIQLTGVASRQVGYFMCGFLILCGVVPIVGQTVAALPGPVFGGAMLLLFAYVATSGMKILSHTPLSHRDWMIAAAALGSGLGVASNPTVLESLPPIARAIFSSGVVTGGLTAVLLNAVLPARMAKADP